MRKYGFWIIPENEVYDEMQEAITKYSSKYKTPSFKPHMTIHTVVSSTDERVVKDTKKAVAKINPFKLTVGNIEFSTTFFQCVFARINTNANLMNAHLALREHLKYKDKHVYMPHASLVYGDLDMETREKICSEIKLKGKEFTANTLLLYVQIQVTPMSGML